MCANYTPTRRDLLEPAFGVAPPGQPYGEEAYPGAMAPFILTEAGVRRANVGMFGMVPHWADARLARSTYNARSETASGKPSFRDAWRNGQFCLVPAESIFEPCYASGKAVRWEIAAAGGEPLALAGLWTRKENGAGEAPLLSFTMLTINADAHPLMRRMHKPEDEKRMVVLLRPDQYDGWLACPPAQAGEFLREYPAGLLQARPAPRIVARTPAPQGSLFD